VKLYCLCAQPDSEEGDFYLGCETCDGWYHPSCIGMSEEAAQARSEKGRLDHWRCPACTHVAVRPLAGIKAIAVDADWRAFAAAEEADEDAAARSLKGEQA
jgi:hypothetical protein